MWKSMPAESVVEEEDHVHCYCHTREGMGHALQAGVQATGAGLLQQDVRMKGFVTYKKQIDVNHTQE
jgi:hypothetical protein